MAAAAFRRLCVETGSPNAVAHHSEPAAFRRLCVETAIPPSASIAPDQPPSGGCVLKH